MARVAGILVIAATLAVVFLSAGRRLVLTDRQSGEEYAAFSVEEGDTFSIEFIHSVNQTPVVDMYEIRGRDFYVTQTRYYGFGAGVQTEIEEGQTLSYAEDGAMIVSGFNKKMTGMSYLVGMASDHILKINDEEYSLTALCGRGSSVVFTIRTGSLFK